MAYESSYDSGSRPFMPDKSRGKWSTPTDFFFACIGHAFKVDAIFIMPAIMFKDFGIYILIPYFITIVLCIIPIVFMQSFLGQFSSSGFISVFRISPLFKGIGYVALAINITILAFFSVLGAIPLFFLLFTFRPTIPWSCEGAAEWMDSERNESSICVKNLTLGEYTRVEIPSIEFFNYHINPMSHKYRHPSGQFSWLLMICAFLIWGIVAWVMTKPVETIGKYLRHSCQIVIGVLAICVLRFLLLPGVVTGIKKFATAWKVDLFKSICIVPLMAFSALGPGFGSILTMASYNKFDTNIFKYSWLLCLAQAGITLGLAFLSLFITSFMIRHDPKHVYFQSVHSQWMEFLIIPTGLTFLELPHIWSWMFFTMMILGCLNLMVVQLLSVLTSLFDEFENLRPFKKHITTGLIIGLAFISIPFCSNTGITFFEHLTQFSLMSQLLLNLFLIIVVVWVYGRDRFQRDVNFMTNRTYSTWMVNVMRFVAPIFILLAWLVALLYTVGTGYEVSLWGLPFVILLCVLVPLLPWCLIPGYCIFKVIKTTGLLGMRFRKCCRPTDWYPVDPVDRQKYEEAFSEADFSHNIATEIPEDV